MSKLTQIILMTSFGFMSAIAQDQKGINPPKTDSDLLKMKGFLRNDASAHPYSSDEVQKFCDYINDNPIAKELRTNDEVPTRKIEVAQSFYQYTKDEIQKKKILDLMIGMFAEIQEARDALGVDPLFDEESWLYVDPSPPVLSEKEVQDFKGGMTSSNPRTHEIMNRKSAIHLKIGHLQHIHACLHRAITHEMKIPLEGISPKLERSPAEKARTKDLLEAQAAALGRKKPEPKTPANEGK